MPDDVETLRSAYEALNEGDMGAFLALLSREIRWKGDDEGTDPDTYAGHTGVNRFYATRLEVWSELRQEPAELIERGERVVAVVDTTTKGRASGVQLEERSAHLWQVRGGKIVSFEAFSNRDEALTAASA